MNKDSLHKGIKPQQLHSNKMVMEKWGQGSEGLRKGEKVVISPESPQQEEGQ